MENVFLDNVSLRCVCIDDDIKDFSFNHWQNVSLSCRVVSIIVVDVEIFRCFKPVLSTFTHAQREILQSRKEKLSSSGFSFVRGYFFRCLQRRENYNFKINKTVERNVEENPRRFSQSMKKNFKVFLAMCFSFSPSRYVVQSGKCVSV